MISSRGRRRPSAARRLLLVAAAALVAAGCSSSGSDAASAGPASTAVTGAPASTLAAPTTTAVAAAGPVQLLTDQASTVLGQPLSYPTGGAAQVSSAIITLDPGAETGLHRHDAPMYAYILDGEVTVTYDGGVVKAYPAGTALLEAVGTAHNGRNLGSKPVRILVVNIGAKGVQNTVKL